MGFLAIALQVARTFADLGEVLFGAGRWIAVGAFGFTAFCALIVFVGYGTFECNGGCVSNVFAFLFWVVAMVFSYMEGGVEV